MEDGEDCTWGFIDNQGTLVIPCDYYSVSLFYKGLARVVKDSKVGLINTKGEFVVPLGEYDEIRYENEPLKKARMDEYQWWSF